MEELLDFFKNKKNLVNTLLLGILVLALPLGVNLIRQQQILRSRAAAEPIVFSGPNVKTINNKLVATKPEVTLEITAPGDKEVTPGSGSCPTQEQVAQAGLDKNPLVKGEILKFSGWPSTTSALQIANEWIKIAPQDYRAQQLKKELDEAAACKSANSGGLGSLLVGTVYAQSCQYPETCDLGDSKSGVRTCSGSIQDGVCKWDPSVATNCTTCESTGSPAGPSCQYPETCDGGAGVRTCNGSIQGGICQWDSNVATNCTACKPAGDTAKCTGSISFSGTCTSKSLSASWDLTNVYGSCNIYLRGGSTDQVISNSCSGSKTITTFSGAPLTNDGIYELFVSNGDQTGSGTCYNVSKGTVTIPCGQCNGGKPTGTITKQQADCVVAKKPYIVDFYGKNGWCTKPEGYQAIVYDWYKGLVDAKEKADVSSCLGTSSGACTVSNWSFSNSNPSPNTLIKATVKGVSNATGWTNIVYKKDNEGWVTTKVDIGPDYTFSFDVNSGANGAHTITLGTSNGTTQCTPTGSFTTGGTTPPVNPVNIVAFRISEDPTTLDSVPKEAYTAPSPVVKSWTFKDPKPGTKTIFVQFYDKDDKKVGGREQASIELVGEMVISSCSLGFEGANVVFTINGSNFGSEKGTVTSDTNQLQIRDWKPTQIKAFLTNPPTGQSFPVTVANTFAQIDGSCSAISALSVGGSYFCHAPQDKGQSDVEMVLVGQAPGEKQIKQKVNIDQDGTIQGLDIKLEEGKKYKISLKAPKSVRKVSEEFTAASGATNVSDFVLPVGDIFPIDSPDGQINSLDKAELNREWVIAADITGRPGDFNQDSRVNSIDWSCMRQDFGSSDDPEPVAPSSSTAP